MKKCIKCSIVNPDNANYCRHCGNTFITENGQKVLYLSQNQEVLKLKQEVLSLKRERRILTDELNATNETFHNKHRCSSSKLIHLIYLFVIILCAVAITFFIIKTISQQDYISKLEIESKSQRDMLNNDSIRIRQLESNSKDLNTTLAIRNDEFKELSSIYPFIITSIDIKNEGEEYGATIYEKNTTFIYNKINIKSHISGSVTINVKFYRPNGELTANNKSPVGFSYSQQINLEKGETTYSESNGWGNTDKGHWKSGQYYMEFWYNNKCFYRKGFYISSL